MGLRTKYHSSECRIRRTLANSNEPAGTRRFMGSSQTVLHEPLIGAPAIVVESNTLTRVRRPPSEMQQAETLELLSINTIRTLAMDAVQKANSGHPGTPMALA